VVAPVVAAFPAVLNWYHAVEAVSSASRMSRFLADYPHSTGMTCSADGVPRTLCSGKWPGVEFYIKEQDISRLTTWSIQRESHVVVVHLDGAIHRLETELPGVGGVMDPPMPGEVWVIPSGTRYSSLAQGGSVRYAELFIDPELNGVHADEAEVGARAGHYDPFLHRGVERLDALMHKGDDLARMMSQTLSRTLGLHLFLEYARGAGVRKQRRGPLRLSGAQERMAKEYIETHLGEPLTIDALGAKLQIKTHHLLIAFRGSFGTTPAQYVIEQRLRRARWLLLSTGRDIMSIALDTGFSSHGHFTNLFHSRVGTSPREFRASQKLCLEREERS